MILSKIFNFFKTSAPLTSLDAGLRRDLGIAAPYANSYALRSPFKGGNGHY